MTLTALALLLLLTAAAHARTSARGQLRAELHRVAHARTTLRFFERHPRLLYARDQRTRRRAWHAVALAREQIIRGEGVIRRLRLKLAPAIPHLAQWLCIHRGEGAWADSGAPYWGGLQMDLEFMRDYAPRLYRLKGTADHWTPREQMQAAERAWRTRGFYPWPVTARACGLL